MLLPVSLRHWDPRRTDGFRLAAKENFRFGNRALTGNLLLDLNTRVDVFLLGVFLSDRLVGLYSFAATVAEGVMQLPVLFRNNINPVLTRAWHAGGAALTGRIVSRGRRAFFRILAPLALVTVPLFPVALWVLGMKDEPFTVWILYSILIAGVAGTAGYLPFQMTFNQLGRPGLQTLFIFIGFIANVLLNLLLIPALGIYGSAAGTALAMLVSVVAWRMLMMRAFGLRA
jgi:O-antigen/teichoic acid export membrane protein